MKSLLDIRKEIIEVIEKDYSSNGSIHAAREKLQLLRMIEMYLEGYPTEWFIMKEIARLENRISILSERYCEKLYSCSKKPVERYEEDMGIPYLRLQIRALNFIKRNT